LIRPKTKVFVIFKRRLRPIRFSESEILRIQLAFRYFSLRTTTWSAPSCS